MKRPLLLIAAGAFAGPLALLLMIVILGGNLPTTPTPAPPGTGILGGPLADTAPVPAAYRPLITQAGSLCPLITPSLLAAQLHQESNFNPNARSPAGALGIAQFLPTSWPSWATDVDGGGADPFDPADAITAQGRFMCALAAHFAAAIAIGAVRDTTVDAAALAGYNAGQGAVDAAHGIPPYPETEDYVARITALLPRYTAPSAIPARGVPAAPAGP